MDNNQYQEKTERPSEQRINEFRKKGDVAISRELTSLLVLSASCFALTLSFSSIFEELKSYTEWVYHLEIQQIYSRVGFQLILLRTIATGFKVIFPVLFVILVVGVGSIVGQIGFLFSIDILMIDLKRLDPISGFKKLFSIRSLIEAMKGFLKFTLIIVIVYFFIDKKLNIFSEFYSFSFVQSIFKGKEIIIELIFTIIGGFSIIAFFDLLYQKISYQNKIMMTREEMKKELKEQDGNPEIKQKIKVIQKELSKKRMITAVQGADVIVTNPTHLSVAIKYDHDNMISPLVVGKGADLLALKIREIAREYKIPIVENIALARKLYQTVKVDHPIPRELYKTVAEVLAFVYNSDLRRKR